MKCGRLRFGVVKVSAAFCAAALVASGVVAPHANLHATAVSPAPEQPLFDDVPEPLPADRVRSPAEQDHLEAVSLFLLGRTHEQRDEFAEALRCYARSLRCDPQAAAVARAIVPVAVHLKRYAVAVRYATKAIAMGDVDPLAVRRLGLYLAEEGEPDKAAEFYATALSSRANEKDSVADVLLRMELGRLQFQMEKFKLAAENFTKVLYAVEHPDEFGLDAQVKKVILGESGVAYCLFGTCFLMADRLPDAAAAFEKADAANPDPAVRLFHQAQVAAKKGNAAEALAALESSFEQHLGGEGTAPYETLADVLKQLGKSDELIARLEKLRGDDANNVPLAFFLAGRYHQAGKAEKAEELYLVLVQRAATRVGFHHLIELYRETKRYDALLAILGRAIEGIGVFDTLGAASQTLANDMELVRGVVEAARNKHKADPEQLTCSMCQATALLAMETKQYDVAREFFELALAGKPKEPAELYLAWGVGLLVDDHAEEAVKVFQRGIDEKVLPGDNPTFYFYLSGALAMSKRTDEALAAATKAMDMKRSSSRYAERVAWVLYSSKRHAEARAAYEKLLEKFDADASNENRSVLRGARFVLSNICVAENRFAEAEEWLEQVLDEFPDDVSAMNDLGYLWADQNKNLLRAHRMVQKAVEAEPDNMAYRDSLGWTLFRQERYPEAVVELEKACAGKKTDGVVLDHLGDAYEKAQQPEKAIDAWRRAVESLRAEKEIERAEAVEKKIRK